MEREGKIRLEIIVDIESTLGEAAAVGHDIVVVAVVAVEADIVAGIVWVLERLGCGFAVGVADTWD